MNLALAIIAYDEKEKLQNILNLYDSYFEEVVIAYDKDEAIQGLVVKEKVSLIKYEWDDEEKEIGIPDFSKKRNFLADKIKSNYYLRLDTDDLINKPELINTCFEKMIEDEIDVMYVPYVYAKDEDGNTIAEHWRETIVKKRIGIYWKKAIHENVFIEDMKTFRGAKCDTFKIIHDIDESHALKANDRNFKRLVAEFKKDGDNCDVRTISYIGRVLLARGKPEEAIPFLKKLVTKSGWDDDKYFGFIHLAECYVQIGDIDTAIACCNEALHINTKFPDAYIKMGEIYLSKNDFDKALDWLMPGLVRPQPDTMFIIDPSAYRHRVRLSVAFAYLNKGDFENALKYFLEAERMAPSEETVKKLGPLVKEAYERDTYIRNVLWMAMFLSNKDVLKIKDLIKSIPKTFYSDSRIMTLRRKFETPTIWGDNSIVFLCGNTLEEWASPSIIKGVGGSEEAVIYLSKELVSLGYDVTVYNSCGDLAGEYDGVKYKNFYELNPADNFNIVVSWRSNYGKSVTAKNKIVWLHDVPQEDAFSGNEHESFDKILVLSEYHKSLLSKDIPEKKIYISSNGINVKDFNLKVIPERNLKRIIYTSSYDRGLQHLLSIWEDVRSQVPDAELHVYYGWDTYDKFVQAGWRKKDFKDVMVRLMVQPGIFDHGRIGHKKLIQEFYKSGIYAYPCHFEEISCISAMKAQACGCVSLTTDYGALKETVKSGIKIPGKASDEECLLAFKIALIDLLKNTEKQEEIRKSTNGLKEGFGWHLVAKDWEKNVLVQKRNSYKDLEEYRKEYGGPKEWKPCNFDKDGNIYEWERYKTVYFLLKEFGSESHLDVGCSDGALPMYLGLKGIKSDGLEVIEKAMEWAGNKAKNLGLECKFYTGLIEEFNPDKKYDTVSFIEAIEHVINPKAVLNKLEECVKDGGHIIISTPDKNGFFGERNFNPQHINHYDDKDLINLVGHERVVKFFRQQDLLFVVYKKGDAR